MGDEFSVHAPFVASNNFEIKASTIGMVQNSVQFNGLANEDAHDYLSRFLQICSTFKINGVSDDAIRLRLFPFSLRDWAYRWLTSLSQGSIKTWKDMVEKFLGRCPHHGYASRMQVQIIYNGLNYATRQLIDAAAVGSLSNKYPDEAEQLLESMVDVLTRKLDLFMGSSLRSESVMNCSTCGGGHGAPLCLIASSSIASIENVDYIGGQRNQGNPYSSTYNPE
ncbi:uncharacterized protein LOC120258717 [Dioscorea cayenensis subsp. rotundata]|uniref:Uncharacterized protein LOC120258717 n=1 Tax=Dioscorea cayennensis subsp. rotundata TaxID=55577 RepID=A0AB40B4A6_DIOCR|nr:uncharacterized protein LOC120258717 [Dioscorea cayenensis subsp. rotundata]